MTNVPVVPILTDSVRAIRANPLKNRLHLMLNYCTLSGL
jgi:hypothetical protein